MQVLVVVIASNLVFNGQHRAKESRKLWNRNDGCRKQKNVSPNEKYDILNMMHQIN